MPCPPPGDLPDPEMKPVSPAAPALAGGFFTTEPPKKERESESSSVVSDSATPQTIQATGFSRPEYWRVWPFPSPGDLSNPEIEPRSPTLQMDCLPAEPRGQTYYLFCLTTEENLS